MGTILLLLTLLFPSAKRDEKFYRLHPFTPSPYFLIIFVDARHLEYSSGELFLTSLAKHPSDWSKNGDVGHAWICLQGEGKTIVGGHTGERVGMTYTEGVLKGLIKQNPIALLKVPRTDGAFEKGSGSHTPTFAAKFTLTKEKFDAAYETIRTYDFKQYQLTKRQCTSFASLVAKACGIELEDTIDLWFPPYLMLGGKKYLLWTDPKYAYVALPSPDRLELDLQEKVLNGEAEYALAYGSFKSWSEKALDSLYKAPERLQKWLGTW